MESVLWTISAYYTLHRLECGLMLHYLRLPPSKGVYGYLCYSYLTMLALINTFLNTTLQSLNVFLACIMMD